MSPRGHVTNPLFSQQIVPHVFAVIIFRMMLTAIETGIAKNIILCPKIILTLQTCQICLFVSKCVKQMVTEIFSQKRHCPYSIILSHLSRYYLFSD